MTSNASGALKDVTFKVLGVCGGIGSGKSSASKMLVADLNCLAHLDADSIGHSIYSPGSEAVKAIGREFGADVLSEDGQEVIRKNLGAIVFSDEKEMKKLEKLVWPHIKVKLQTAIDAHRQEWSASPSADKLPIVVLEAAVLLDADWTDLLDGVWVVKASRETALQRLIETRDLSKEESMKRIKAQTPRRGIGNLDEEVKNNVVTTVIGNDGSLEDLKKSLASALNDPKSWN